MLKRILAGAFGLCVLIACHRPASVSGKLPQRAYLWQREWTPAVSAAAVEAGQRLDGVVLLGAEILWAGSTPRVVRPAIDWDFLRRSHSKITLALRIAPYGGPFTMDDSAARLVAETARSLAMATREQGMDSRELQVDFDCAQARLAGYRLWLRTLRTAIAPTRLVITTLPSWLGEGEFRRLLEEVDGYILQVHSVPTTPEAGRAVLCDPALARAWVKRAARLGRPFSVALPTYRCLAGYGHDGRLLGVAMDGVQPGWPAGTRTIEFRAEADELADLVAQWTKEHPPELRELLWYRAPVARDLRNWRWPTLAAVAAGQRPTHRLSVVCEGSPADVFLQNEGEAEESLAGTVTVTWRGSTLAAAEALPAWAVQVGNERAVFTTGIRMAGTLPPGERRPIGWLRYDHPADLHAAWSP